MEVGDGDARGQARIAGIFGAHERCRFGDEVVDGRHVHAVVDARDHLLGYLGWVDLLGIESVAQFLYPCSNLVEHDGHTPTIALDDLHLVGYA